MQEYPLQWLRGVAVQEVEQHRLGFLVVGLRQGVDKVEPGLLAGSLFKGTQQCLVGSFRANADQRLGSVVTQVIILQECRECSNFLLFVMRPL